MSKKKIDIASTASKFMSGIDPEAQRQEGKSIEEKQSYIPAIKEVGANRPKSVDKKTGEVTKQIGYFVTVEQDRQLKLLAANMGTNKSELLREAIRMYFDYLEREGVK